MEISPQQDRQAFAGWLRTGRWRISPSGDDLARKFNPNHDPSNGRFTWGGSSAGGNLFGGGGSTQSWAKPSSGTAKLPRPPAPVARSQTSSQTRPSTGTTKPLDRLLLAPPVPPSVSGLAQEQRHEIRNGYTYVIDADGRTREVSGDLHLSPTAPRSREAQRAAGGPDRRPTDHGGHYIAARFDGPTDAFNHFAQDANFNIGPYRVLEEKWAKALRSGKAVTVTITPSHIGGSKRPSELFITYTNGGYVSRRHFHNEHQGKLYGK